MLKLALMLGIPALLASLLVVFILWATEEQPWEGIKVFLPLSIFLFIVNFVIILII